MAPAVLAAVVAALLFAVLPKGLKGRPLSPQSYVTIAHNKRIVLILLVTLLQTSGQFTVFIYLAPLLKALTGAGAAVASTYFAFYGVVGLLGNVVASAIVTALGTQKTLALFMASTLFGLALWAVGAGWLLVMGAGVFFWAFGFSAINSMQQARLVAAAPDLASASVALNTSVLYVGQAIGSGIGGLFVCARILPRRRLCWRGLCGRRVCRACGDVGIRRDVVASSREMRRSFLFVWSALFAWSSTDCVADVESAERQSDAEQKGA